MRKKQRVTRSKRRAVIAVIGDSRVKHGSAQYRVAESIGCGLVDAGFRVLTGGLGGIMEAVFRGAKRSRRYAPGDTIAILPGANPNRANKYVLSPAVPS